MSAQTQEGPENILGHVHPRAGGRSSGKTTPGELVAPIRGVSPDAELALIALERAEAFIASTGLTDAYDAWLEREAP